MTSTTLPAPPAVTKVSFIICAAQGGRIDPNTADVVFAGMLGVSAMAVQNALVRVSLTGAPSTAVMTTNVTTFTMSERCCSDATRNCKGAQSRQAHLADYRRLRSRLRIRSAK
jgi:uncharacterized membrane protein YoaK (UPF0700 family)